MTRAECQAIWKAAKRGDDVRLAGLLGLTGDEDARDDVARNIVNWIHHRRGTTSLMAAAASNRSNGSAECVRLLLFKGADVNAVSQDMNTPLHYAAEGSGDDPVVVQMLLDAGADPFAVNRRGHTPLDIARIRKRKLVARALTEKMQVHADWLCIRGTFRWRRRWGVLMACNSARSATELCLFRDRDTVRPEAVLLMDETATAFRFSSTDSYCWLKRADAFTLSKPVMCQRVRGDKFTRAPVCRKTMSFADSETVNMVFAAEGDARLQAWMRALSRAHGRQLSNGSSFATITSTGLRSTENELYYWPHQLSLSQSLDQQQLEPQRALTSGSSYQQQESLPAAAEAAAIVQNSRPQQQRQDQYEIEDERFPPSQRRMERARSAGAGERPERTVTFAPVVDETNQEVSPLEQLRQQYREYQLQRRLQQEREQQEQQDREQAEAVATITTDSTVSVPEAVEAAVDAEPSNTPDENQDIASRDRQGREQCLICVNAPRDAVCTPCGHLSACHACLRTIIRSTRTCPICRARIRSVMRIYDA